jgi:hypothetical protein
MIPIISNRCVGNATGRKVIGNSEITVNQENLKPFRKGDPRINRLGRPKTFSAFRELAQQIAHETATANGQDVIINGHKVTVAEAILRQWAMSKNPQLVKAFIEISFGKVPDEVNLDMIGRILIEYAGNTDEQSEG